MDPFPVWMRDPCIGTGRRLVKVVDAVVNSMPPRKRLSVLTLCFEFPPLGGGGSKVARGLASMLARRGHEVDLVTTRGRGLAAHERIDGFDVWRVPAVRTRPDVSSAFELATYVLPSLYRAMRLCRARRYDVVHAHFILPDGVVAWIMRLVTGRRYIVTAHGSDVPGFNPDRFHLAHRLMGPLWRRIVRDADAIICPSPWLRQLLHRQTAQAATLVVPNGFDPERFRVDDPSSKTVDLLCVSRLLERKGLQHILAAAARLERPPRIHVVGDGPYAAELRAKAEALPLDVTFHGWLDNDSVELERLFRRCGIFALPSSSENFPVSLLEAMSSSMAIITTADSGCQDVVGDAALLTAYGDVDQLADALGRLVGDEKERFRLATAARRRLVDHFSWDAVARQYVDVYRTHPADPGPADASLETARAARGRAGLTVR